MAKKQNKKGLVILGLSVLGVIGVAAGASAIITKGFTKSLTDGVTETESVMKLKAISMDGDVVTFSNESEEDEVTLSVNVEGELTVDENDEKVKTLTLGDNESAGNISKENLEVELTGLGMTAKSVEKVENEVVALNYAKGNSLNFTIDVEYDEYAATSAYTEVAYFDAIRINYVALGQRMVVHANTGVEGKEVASYHKQIITGRTVSEDFQLTALEKDYTLSKNNLSFTVYSLANDKDNRVTIESIELLRTTKGHENQYCWFVQ